MTGNTLWNGSDERVAITGNTYPVKDRLKARRTVEPGTQGVDGAP